MLDAIKAFLKRLGGSKEYEDWKRLHKNSYLCSAFTIGNDVKNVKWQLDFFDPDGIKITSFIEANDEIKLKEDDIFKRPEAIVNELDIEKVKIDLEKAISNIEKLKKKKYPGENPTQKIIILQNLTTVLWNITYINTSFNILNIKVDAINGKIIDDSLTPIMRFKDQRFDKSALDKIKK
ncbi:hypothetical protein HYX18_04840 [Candidatus Woesearchaeota archaeon]|nr:hypothetical protein [Candidatus Woesearchaeota archaeon]